MVRPRFNRDQSGKTVPVQMEGSRSLVHVFDCDVAQMECFRPKDRNEKTPQPLTFYSDHNRSCVGERIARC